MDTFYRHSAPSTLTRGPLALPPPLPHHAPSHAIAPSSADDSALSRLRNLSATLQDIEELENYLAHLRLSSDPHTSSRHDSISSRAGVYQDGASSAAATPATSPSSLDSDYLDWLQHSLESSISSMSTIYEQQEATHPWHKDWRLPSLPPALLPRPLPLPRLSPSSVASPGFSQNDRLDPLLFHSLQYKDRGGTGTGTGTGSSNGSSSSNFAFSADLGVGTFRQRSRTDSIDHRPDDPEIEELADPTTMTSADAWRPGVRASRPWSAPGWNLDERNYPSFELAATQTQPAGRTSLPPARSSVSLGQRDGILAGRRGGGTYGVSGDNGRGDSSSGSSDNDEDDARQHNRNSSNPTTTRRATTTTGKSLLSTATSESLALRSFQHVNAGHSFSSLFSGLQLDDPNALIPAGNSGAATPSLNQAGLFRAPYGPSPNNKKVDLYKTELCRQWEEKGWCDYKERCQFAHGPAELRPIQRHPLYKTQICKAFVETGHCQYGRRCTFRHDISNGPFPQTRHPSSTESDKPLIARLGRASEPTPGSAAMSCRDDVRRSRMSLTQSTAGARKPLSPTTSTPATTTGSSSAVSAAGSEHLALHRKSASTPAPTYGV